MHYFHNYIVTVYVYPLDFLKTLPFNNKYLISLNLKKDDNDVCGLVYLKGILALDKSESVVNIDIPM
jgi:hypothetical protein